MPSFEQIKIPSAANEEERTEKISALEQKARQRATDTTSRRYSEGCKLKEASENDIEIIDSLLERAAEKFKELGIDDIENLLPTSQNIVMVETPEDTPSAVCLVFFIRLNLPEGITMADPLMQKILLHELTHFITEKIYSEKEKGVIKKRAEGYDQSADPLDRQVFGEGLAELTAFFCYDEETDYQTPYPERVAFLMSLIEDLAQRKGETPIETYKTMFRCYVKRDPLLLRELVQYYGKEITRGIRNIRTLGSRTADETLEDMDGVAVQCGIKEKYVDRLKQLEAGEGIAFFGTKGQFVKGEMSATGYCLSNSPESLFYNEERGTGIEIYDSEQDNLQKAIALAERNEESGE